MTHRPAIRPFAAADTERVVELWHACGLIRPWNDPRKDIERKLKVQPELFLVANEAGDPPADDVVGTAMAGYDGHRGWIYYLAVDPACQGRGYGRALLAAVESRLISLGCPKLNFQIRKDNGSVIAFYEALGFDEDDCFSFGKRLIPDPWPASQ
ncbi:GNAT family acetyltransferase [Nonomuraea zeae]|uniref:GNAT family acetyltransferase n=1 Tax=Nonomuraea zeae TaxID=1642303 RepID=A0A5S4GMX1_9ACTN|nr:GNAT family acetyltransferase [Nonomuraea zeae]TMR34257.1 GNAT family acetyltransferase [Nonomuraea zeae]